jgi:hypothetical protein
MTRNVRWICPTEGADHAAVLAPSKPRNDDVRRYCLECSRATGRLVRRVPPALDKAREAKRAKAEARKQARLARRMQRAAAYYTVAGINLMEEMRRFLKLPVFKGTPLLVSRFGRSKMREPTLVIRRRTLKPRRFGCAQYARWRIIIADYPGIDEHCVRDTLLHELCHLACPPFFMGKDKGKHHGVKWKNTYRLACEQAFGIRPRVENRFVHEVTQKLREAAKRDAEYEAHLATCCGEFETGSGMHSEECANYKEES